MGMNIGEIARRAGVSRSTVSHALTGKRAVSEATRRRILDVIDELTYRPNASARALKEGRTRTVGLVIPPAQQRLTLINRSTELVATGYGPAHRAVTGAARHWAGNFRPPLTAADVAALEMGAHAVEPLLERIAQPEAPSRHLLLTPPVSLRESTGPAFAKP
jgi:DNA-binding LacI/PurR family transcriptional regulator